MASDDFAFFFGTTQEPLDDTNAFTAQPVTEADVFAADIIDVFDMDALL